MAWGQILIAAFLGWLTLPWVLAMIGSRSSSSSSATA